MPTEGQLPHLDQMIKYWLYTVEKKQSAASLADKYFSMKLGTYYSVCEPIAYKDTLLVARLEGVLPE